MNALKSPTNPQEALPAAYASFLPILERLSDPLHRALEGQLVEFERHLDPVERPHIAPLGEFEGFGGLSHRGDISQIVQSELLLRSEAPLEFLRRLAEGETLYHEKLHADPGARHIYRALISIGPGVLGHGRIVALAAIFYLARIARERKADFHWCMLPNVDDALWFDEVSVRTVKRFMRSTSFREMSREDAVDAWKTWQDRVPAPCDKVPLKHFDWAIGAASALDAARDGLPNALAFTIAPPLVDAPRTADIALRQSGFERSRAPVTFPDDRVCASAITNPFQPFKPSPTSAPGGKCVPPLAGWETCHFDTLRGGIKIVRTSEGLLIFRSFLAGNGSSDWFVPLPPGVTLAGAHVAHGSLSILVHDGQPNRDALHYASIFADGSSGPFLQQHWQKHVSSAQLFKNRSVHAVPPLVLHADSVEFHARNGAPFRLRSQTEDGMTLVGLTAPPSKTKFAKLLTAAGSYRIQRAAGDITGRVEVMKDMTGRVGQFVLPMDAFDRLRGMTYSPGTRALAYSNAPGTWAFAALPGGTGRADDALMRLEPHEWLLMANPGKRGVSLRIWSDARYGGDGRVRSERREAHQTVARQAPVKLGEDALAVVKVEAADDGIWAAVEGSDGFPATLLHYRHNKKQSRHECDRHSISDLTANAVRIELGFLNG